MQVTIKNCHNINTATVTLSEKKLNIKFAPNGTGKSTIAKALTLKASKNGDLNELTPFKLKTSNPNNKKPEINIPTGLETVMCFNESYVEQFTFKKEELLKNSFDVFIKTDNYKIREKKIR